MPPAGALADLVGHGGPDAAGAGAGHVLEVVAARIARGVGVGGEPSRPARRAGASSSAAPATPATSAPGRGPSALRSRLKPSAMASAIRATAGGSTYIT